MINGDCPVCRMANGNTKNHIDTHKPAVCIINNKQCPDCRQWDCCMETRINTNTQQVFYTCLNCRAQLVDVGKVQLVNISEKRRHLHLLPRVHA